MLGRFRAKGFKSLEDVTVDLPKLTVVFGPNATGKSNLLDAIQVLSRCVTERTLTEALTEPVRGLPAEAFSLPGGGLPELLRKKKASFELGAWVEPKGRDSGGNDEPRKASPLGYRVQVDITPGTGVREFPERVALLLCRRAGRATELVPFQSDGPLWTDTGIREALRDSTEEELIEAALIRGWLDA